MDVVFTHYSFQYLYVFNVTDLYDEFSATLLYITTQYGIPVFGDPYYMGGEASDRVAISALFHTARLAESE
jgi:hypothetical protein